MEYISPTPWIDSIVFGLFISAFVFVIWFLWIPKRTHVFMKQCCRRFSTLFTGYEVLVLGKKKPPFRPKDVANVIKKFPDIKIEFDQGITFTSPQKQNLDDLFAIRLPVPRILIVGLYLFCYVIAVILLS